MKSRAMRIGIVNDVAIVAEALKHMVVSVPGYEVAWIASSGIEAVDLCARDVPDLILMDMRMPGVDGVEATRRIMAATPCAILVVTDSVEGSAGRVFEALGAGALDAIDTPVLAGPGSAEGIRLFLAKIALLGKLIRPAEPASRPGTPANRISTKPWLFAIGASAGGPVALAQVLGAFPARAPMAFVVVQHLDRKFAPGLADWLGKQIALPVLLARDGDAPRSGTVLLPDREDHLVLTPAETLAYTASPAEYVYRPSVDAFFKSVATHWRGSASGVLLTGMGRDGADGLKRMRQAGFATIAQDRKTSAVYGMPKAAAEIGAAEKILPLSEIGPELLRQAGGR